LTVRPLISALGALSPSPSGPAATGQRVGSKYLRREPNRKHHREPDKRQQRPSKALAQEGGGTHHEALDRRRQWAGRHTQTEHRRQHGLSVPPDDEQRRNSEG